MSKSTDTLSVIIESPGDPNAGIFGITREIDLGIVPEDVTEEHRDLYRSLLKDAFGEIWDGKVRVRFSDEPEPYAPDADK